MSPTERLATLDERGARQRVIPAEIHGRYRTWRDRTYFILVLIFLGLPWIKIGGYQAVHLNIPDRHFELFGQLFLAHDAPLIFFILAILALSLATMTAVWGRIWCGWACPQTVFIDGIYRRIEIWIEGGYVERRKLYQQPMNLNKFLKVSAKWLLFFVVSSLFAHSFAAYFVGSDQIIQMIQRSPTQNWTSFTVVTFITALLLFDFGWFREQFCLIMCPYGRFQSVLMDSNSVTVLYDEKRGEPRKAPNDEPAKRGDCVSCLRCVQVCPTGIDIRDGIQMECIACTACIDACDEIMHKVKKPEGLIRYQSLAGQGTKLIRPRILAYASLIALCVVGLTISVANRRPYSVTILRAKDTPYQLLADDQVLNHFKAHFLNQSGQDQEFELSLPEAEAAQGVKLTQSKAKQSLKTGEGVEAHFFISFPKQVLNATGERTVHLRLQEHGSGREEDVHVITVGPGH